MSDYISAWERMKNLPGALDYQDGDGFVRLVNAVANHPDFSDKEREACYEYLVDDGTYDFDSMDLIAQLSNGYAKQAAFNRMARQGEEVLVERIEQGQFDTVLGHASEGWENIWISALMRALKNGDNRAVSMLSGGEGDCWDLFREQEQLFQWWEKEAGKALQEGRLGYETLQGLASWAEDTFGTEFTDAVKKALKDARNQPEETALLRLHLGDRAGQAGVWGEGSDDDIWLTCFGRIQELQKGRTTWHPVVQDVFTTDMPFFRYFWSSWAWTVPEGVWLSDQLMACGGYSPQTMWVDEATRIIRLLEEQKCPNVDTLSDRMRQIKILGGQMLAKSEPTKKDLVDLSPLEHADVRWLQESAHRRLMSALEERLHKTAIMRWAGDLDELISFCANKGRRESFYAYGLYGDEFDKLLAWKNADVLKGVDPATRKRLADLSLAMAVEKSTAVGADEKPGKKTIYPSWLDGVRRLIIEETKAEAWKELTALWLGHLCEYIDEDKDVSDNTATKTKVEEARNELRVLQDFYQQNSGYRTLWEEMSGQNVACLEALKTTIENEAHLGQVAASA